MERHPVGQISLTGEERKLASLSLHSPGSPERWDQMLLWFVLHALMRGSLLQVPMGGMLLEMQQEAPGGASIRLIIIRRRRRGWAPPRWRRRWRCESLPGQAWSTSATAAT